MTNESIELSDEEVTDLIQIAKGGLKPKKRYWYTLGIPVPIFQRYYTLDEQLDAIRKLGESRSRTAKDQLKELVKIEREDIYDNPSNLRKKLVGFRDNFVNVGYLKSVLDVSCVPGDWYFHPRHPEAMNVLCKALSKLEESV